MASKPVPPRPMPRLYLATPDVDDPSSLVASLPGLLAGADVAAVLLRLKPADQRSMISRVKALAAAIPDRGAALLLDRHVALVARARADGARRARGAAAALKDVEQAIRQAYAAMPGKAKAEQG